MLWSIAWILVYVRGLDSADLSSLDFCLLLRHRQSSDELALRSSCEGSPKTATAWDSNSVCLLSVLVSKKEYYYHVYYPAESCTALAQAHRCIDFQHPRGINPTATGYFVRGPWNYYPLPRSFVRIWSILICSDAIYNHISLLVGPYITHQERDNIEYTQGAFY